MRNGYCPLLSVLRAIRTEVLKSLPDDERYLDAVYELLAGGGYELERRKVRAVLSL